MWHLVGQHARLEDREFCIRNKRKQWDDSYRRTMFERERGNSRTHTDEDKQGILCFYPYV